MANTLFAICYKTKQGTRWLSGIETAVYGKRLLGYFDLHRSHAFPFTADAADHIVTRLSRDMLTIELLVVPYPVQEVDHD